MTNTRARWAIAAAIAVMGLATQTEAVTTDNLQNLADTSGSLTIGDKTFSDFRFSTSGLTSFDASQIQVSASIANGIYFLTWVGNISLVSGSGPVSAHLLLNYRVTAATGAITMIDQSYTGSAQPTGGAFLAIDETVRDINGNLVANSHLDGNDLSDPLAEPGDNLNLTPLQPTIDISKDIAFGIVGSGFVTVSEIIQSFHQIPEAGTTSLLILGSAIVGFVVRQKLRPKLPL